MSSTPIHQQGGIPGGQTSLTLQQKGILVSFRGEDAGQPVDARTRLRRLPGNHCES